MKPDLFTYIDYRSFLKDEFAFIKSKSRRLSYRIFAKQAGFTSPNFLQMIIQGKRNLNSTHTIGAAKAFNLNKQETEFFQNLVGYNQARSLDEKNLFYQKILRTKRYGAIKAIEKNQYEYFSHWYIPAVRELLTHKNFNLDNAWIAERIFPRITGAQVENAKNLLQSLKLIHWDPALKRWQLRDMVISTESETLNLAVHNYHQDAIQLAKDSVKAFSPEERDIRSVTLGLSAAAFLELKSRMEAFWKELLEFAGTQREADAVHQVNLQLFPLTKESKS